MRIKSVFIVVIMLSGFKGYCNGYKNKSDNIPNSVFDFEKANPVSKPGRLFAAFPQFSAKAGSQRPQFGGDFKCSVGKTIGENWFLGTGAGYTTNMGLGDYAIPVFFESRHFIKPYNSEIRKLQLEIQAGIDFNKGGMFKNGLFSTLGFYYLLFQNFEKKVNAIYFGPFAEIKSGRFYESSHGFVLHEGSLTQLVFGIKLSSKIGL